MGALGASWPTLCVIASVAVAVASLTRPGIARSAVRLAARMYACDPARRRTSLEQWTADLGELRPSERPAYVGSLLAVSAWRLVSLSPERRRVGRPLAALVGGEVVAAGQPTRIPVVGRVCVAAAFALALAACLSSSSSAPDVHRIFGIRTSLAVVQPSARQLLVVGRYDDCRFDMMGGVPICSSKVVLSGAALDGGTWTPGSMETFGTWTTCSTDVTSLLVEGTKSIVVACSDEGSNPALLVLLFPPSIDEPTVALALSCPLASWHVAPDRLVLDLAYPSPTTHRLVRSATTYRWFSHGLDTGLFVASSRGRPLFVVPQNCLPLTNHYVVPPTS